MVIRVIRTNILSFFQVLFSLLFMIATLVVPNCEFPWQFSLFLIPIGSGILVLFLQFYRDNFKTQPTSIKLKWKEE